MLQAGGCASNFKNVTVIHRWTGPHHLPESETKASECLPKLQRKRSLFSDKFLSCQCWLGASVDCLDPAMPAAISLLDTQAPNSSFFFSWIVLPSLVTRE